MKTTNGTHTPSKHIPLKRLQQIQKDNCIGETGKEFTESEVQERINELKQSHAENLPYEFPPVMPSKPVKRGVTPNPVIYNRPTSRHAKLVYGERLTSTAKIGFINLFRAIVETSDVSEESKQEQVVKTTQRFVLSCK